MSSKTENGKSKLLESKVKILTEDRKNFLKICKLFGLTDCDLVFESASLNETPVDLDDLVANHGDTLLINRELNQFCFDMLTDIFGPDNQDIVPMVIRDRDIDRVRTRIGDLLRSGQENSQHSILSKSDTCTQTQITLDVAEIQTDTTEDTKSHLTADLESQVCDLQKEVCICKEQIDRKDDEICTLNKELVLLKNRLANLAILEDVALRQASRDAELAILRAQLASTKETNPETDLESSIFRKNILIKVLTYSLTGDYGKLEHMVPIICAIFQLDESEAIELSKLCASLNNQGILGSMLANWK